jgi:hypothetical protein
MVYVVTEGSSRPTLGHQNFLARISNIESWSQPSLYQKEQAACSDSMLVVKSSENGLG